MALLAIRTPAHGEFHVADAAYQLYTLSPVAFVVGFNVHIIHVHIELSTFDKPLIQLGSTLPPKRCINPLGGSFSIRAPSPIVVCQGQVCNLLAILGSTKLGIAAQHEKSD